MHGRLVSEGGRGISVRRLGQDRAGEMRITRFLHNRAVNVSEMVETALARTCRSVGARHVLAIQDTTTVQAGEDKQTITLHPVIAVDAAEGTLLGLVDAAFCKGSVKVRACRKGRVKVAARPATSHASFDAGSRFQTAQRL